MSQQTMFKSATSECETAVKANFIVAKEILDFAQPFT